VLPTPADPLLPSCLPFTDTPLEGDSESEPDVFDAMSPAAEGEQAGEPMIPT
jgi:hypothetical protein